MTAKDDPVTTATASRPAGPRLFNALAGVTTLGIFLQAITAGEFVSQEHRDGWVTAHGLIANGTIFVALVTAVLGLALFRRERAALSWASAVLFVLLVAQSAIGYLITNAEQDGWIGVHVPLAFVIFGLTIWISVRGALARRASSGS
jgi:hypothetical protein